MSKTFYSKGVSTGHNASKSRTKEKSTSVTNRVSIDQPAEPLKTTIQNMKENPYWASSNVEVEQRRRDTSKHESKVRKTKNFIKSNIENVSSFIETCKSRKASLIENGLSSTENCLKNNLNYNNLNASHKNIKPKHSHKKSDNVTHVTLNVHKRNISSMRGTVCLKSRDLNETHEGSASHSHSTMHKTSVSQLNQTKSKYLKYAQNESNKLKLSNFA